MKVIINKCYGGFGLSPRAIQLYLSKIGKECFFYKQTGYSHQGNEKHEKVTLEEAEKVSSLGISVYTKDMGDVIRQHTDEHFWYDGFYGKERAKKELVETVEELGVEKASGQHAKLYIADIPDDIEWELDEYDGVETIREKHRSW
jgi:hypothetical protein